MAGGHHGGTERFTPRGVDGVCVYTSEVCVCVETKSHDPDCKENNHIDRLISSATVNQY